MSPFGATAIKFITVNCHCKIEILRVSNPKADIINKFLNNKVVHKIRFSTTIRLALVTEKLARKNIVFSCFYKIPKPFPSRCFNSEQNEVQT
jgi:uncharacterized protein YaiL (DUF2058 family)